MTSFVWLFEVKNNKPMPNNNVQQDKQYQSP